MCPAKDKHDSQAHITSCTLKETVHIHPKSFVTSSILVEQEPRGAGACDTCCNRTVAGQEWMNDYVHSIKKSEIGRMPWFSIGVILFAKILPSMAMKFVKALCATENLTSPVDLPSVGVKEHDLGLLSE